jgi:hypothetical protein
MQSTGLEVREVGFGGAVKWIYQKRKTICPYHRAFIVRPFLVVVVQILSCVFLAVVFLF